jgi:hypothetical protein
VFFRKPIFPVLNLETQDSPQYPTFDFTPAKIWT